MKMFDAFEKTFQPFMDWLSTLFQSYPLVATYYTTVCRWIFVALALFILIKSIASLLASKNPAEIWGYLSLPDGSAKPLSHWENVLGRAKSADIKVDVMTVSRNHGTLVRNESGDWKYNDLGSKGGSMVNGYKVYRPTPVEMGDTITMGGANCTLIPPSLEERRRNSKVRELGTKTFAPWASLIALTIFQVLMAIQFIAARGAEFPFSALLSFGLLTLIMWGYCIFLRVSGKTSFEVETIAFFLCTLNLAVVSTKAPESTFKQLLAIVLGLVVFTVLSWYLRDLDRALKIRKLLMILSVALLLVNILMPQQEYGAGNWINIAGYNFQPSELVKIAFIFIGSATLDELFEKKNLTMFILFSVFCLGSLAIMKDFGTAMIFFVAFLVISFLRSGEFSKLILIVAVCAIGGLMAVRFVPHITSRFAGWMHVWDFPDTLGYQQTRAMSGGASGGMLGLGAGEGWTHEIFAADTDLVFSILSEEWGLIIAVLSVLALVTLGIFAVRSITSGRSAFYTIAACTATSLIIFQSALNVLGSLDILPFTGVTLPFISNGGTSMLASWGLLAFLKAADTRRNASFAVAQSKIMPDEEAFEVYEEEENYNE